MGHLWLTHFGLGWQPQIEIDDEKIPMVQGGGAGQSSASWRRGGRGRRLEQDGESRNRFEVLEEGFAHRKMRSMTA
jgi:hypothetical protein